MGVNYQTHT